MDFLELTFSFSLSQFRRAAKGLNKLAPELNELQCAKMADFKLHTSEGLCTSQAISIKINEYVNR